MIDFYKGKLNAVLRRVKRTGQKIVIWDYDGTLSDGRHRLHALPKAEDAHRTDAWYNFNMLAADDTEFTNNVTLCNITYGSAINLILTGRSDHAEQISIDWLDEHRVQYDLMIMRSKDDHRKDTDFKGEIVDYLGAENILCAFDDLEHVAEMFRARGVTCHLVTKYHEERVDTTNKHIGHEEG